LESFCSCCVERCDLLRSEVDYYYRFQKEMVLPYDENNSEHEEHLKALYRVIFNETEMPARSENWKSIGF